MQRSTGTFDCYLCKAVYSVTTSTPKPLHWRKAPEKIKYVEWTFPCCRATCSTTLSIWQTDKESKAPTVWMDLGTSILSISVNKV